MILIAELLNWTFYCFSPIIIILESRHTSSILYLGISIFHIFLSKFWIENNNNSMTKIHWIIYSVYILLVEIFRETSASRKIFFFPPKFFSYIFRIALFYYANFHVIALFIYLSCLFVLLFGLYILVAKDTSYGIYIILLSSNVFLWLLYKDKLIYQSLLLFLNIQFNFILNPYYKSLYAKFLEISSNKTSFLEAKRSLSVQVWKFQRNFVSEQKNRLQLYIS